MKRVRYFSLLVCAAVLFAWCVSPEAQPLEIKPRDTRPAEWAQPIKLDGVPNLYRVDRDVYRSAQPTYTGFKNLERLGIKTVVNLRAFHGNRLTGTSLREIRIKMHAWNPEEEDIVQAVRVLSDVSGGPYLVHSMDGSDRVGLVIAVYRLAVQRWSLEEATDEMVNGGYGFLLTWDDALGYLERFDIEKIRRLIGISDNGRYSI